MISFGVRRTMEVALMLACVTPGAAFPQLDSARYADEVLNRLVDTIEDVRDRSGVHSAELIEPMRALALYYLEHEDYPLAIAAIQQARQAIRVNYGLFSLEEAPLLQQWIRAERARGDAAAAWDVEKKLLKLVDRNADDVRTVPILQEIAEYRMDVLDRYSHGEYPPEIVLGCYYSNPQIGECRSGSRGRAKDSLLREGIWYYSRAINTLLRTEGWSSGQLPELLMAVVRVSYEYGSAGIGRKGLRFLLSYQTENDAPRFTQASALVQIADWDLLFAPDHTFVESALEVYEEAYGQLEQSGMAQRSVDRLFHPEIPVVLPAFLPNPLATSETSETTGFIDVTFDITQEGESEDIEILDTVNASDDEQDRLIDLIDDSRFRPVLANGRVAETARVALRYFLND